MVKQRNVQGEAAVWVGIIGNMSLALLKAGGGLFAGSKGLMADSVHSASIAVSSIAVLIGRKGKRQPPDVEESTRVRAESAVSVILAVLLLLAGVETGISALKAILHGVNDHPKGIAVLIILFSFGIKEGVIWYLSATGHPYAGKSKNDSMAERRVDRVSSLTVFVGVVGSISGEVLDVPSLYYLDASAGVVASLLVLHKGYKLAVEAIYLSMDRVLMKEDIEELVKAAQCVKGVITVNDLRAREHGHYVVVDVNISVNPKITVWEGNEIARMVRQHLMRRFIHVSDVFIHVDPYDPGYPYKSGMDPDQDYFPTLLH